MNLKKRLGRKVAAVIALAVFVTMLVSQMAGAWWDGGMYLIWRGGW